jgi:hypothetical protein
MVSFSEHKGIVLVQLISFTSMLNSIMSHQENEVFCCFVDFFFCVCGDGD